VARASGASEGTALFESGIVEIQKGLGMEDLIPFYDCDATFFFPNVQAKPYGFQEFLNPV